MRTLTILVFLCLCLVVLGTTANKPPNSAPNKLPIGKNGQLPIFDAKPRKSTGPCNPDNTCINPDDVCQKSDGNCFPKGTPGLNDNNKNKNKNKKKNGSSNDSSSNDDSDDSDDSSEEKKKGKGKKGKGKKGKDDDKGTSRDRPECCDRVNPLNGISDCPRRKNLCNIPRFFNLMTQECARTCRRQSKCGSNPKITRQRICTTSRPNCSDTVNGQRFNRCARIRNSGNCRTRRFFNFNRINCRQTCRFC